MARTTKPRRTHGTLRVYLRTPDRGAAKWWVAIPGDQRKALGLGAEVAREEAYRVACERYATGALAGRGAGAVQGPPDASLTEILDAHDLERGPTLKPRSRTSVEYHFGAFVAAMLALKVERPSQITDALLSRWINERVEGGAQHATLNRALGAVRTALRWAAKRQPPLCALTPLDKRPNLSEVDRQPHPVIPSPDEWKRLVSELAADPFTGKRWDTDYQRAMHTANVRGVALLVGVAVHTGLRLDELRHLRGQDCDRDTIHVRAADGWSPKSWAERSIPVGAEVANAAREMVSWRVAAQGLNGAALALGEHWINDRIDAAWSRAKLPGEAPRMHDARRTFATEIVRAGQGLDVARQRLGHRDTGTTERYLGKYRSDAELTVPNVGVLGALAPSSGAAVIPLRRDRR